MFSLNISCAVCKVPFKNDDALYSTSCGHVFHFSCLNKWKCESTSCPVCRSYNPNSYPIYLQFENEKEYENVVKDLKAEIVSHEHKNKKLQEDVDKKVKEKDAVKRLYVISEQMREELQYKIQILEQKIQQHDDENSKTSAEQSEELEMLKGVIEVYENGNDAEDINVKYRELLSENLKLTQSLDESETVKINLNQEIEILQLKLKHVTVELTKQFDENFKNAIKPESLKEEKVMACKKIKKQRQRKRDKSVQSESAKSVVSMEKLNFDMPADEKKHEDFKFTQPNDCKIVIADFPKTKLVYPLKDTIVLLASKMAITVTHDDILNVNIMQLQPGARFILPNTVFILTEFKHMETKIQFLKCKNRLKFDFTTMGIKIKEYMESSMYQLFTYANRKLRANGYQYIAYKNNKIIAKRNVSDTSEITIRDHSHVDMLLKPEYNGCFSRLNF